MTIGGPQGPAHRLAYLTVEALCTGNEVIALTWLCSTPVDDAAASHPQDVGGQEDTAFAGSHAPKHMPGRSRCAK